MKTKHIIISLLALSGVTAVQAQGTVSFDNPWFVNGISYSSLWYFDGMSFSVGVRMPPFDNMAHVGVGLAGHPNNGTPHLEFSNTLGILQYVVFCYTNAASLGWSFTNGSPFGLISVDLADPVAPSPSPIDITFIGYRADGSMVSQTFTVGGGGSSSFQTFYFGPDFAHGLVRVEIPSPAWAMDNLVWVPEPSTWALLIAGSAALVLRQARRRTQTR